LGFVIEPWTASLSGEDTNTMEAEEAKGKQEVKKPRSNKTKQKDPCGKKNNSKNAMVGHMV